MAITLAQAKELSQNKLTGHVIDEFRKSALLDMLPFDNTVKLQGGKTLTYSYNRIKTQPTAAGRAINTEYAPQETDTEQMHVNLKVFGGSFEVDRVIQRAETQVVDHVDFQIKQKVKATRALFHDEFVNGDAGANALEFDGIDKAISGSTTEMIPADAIDLSTSAAIDLNWKVFLDFLRRLRAKLDESPTLWLMNAEMFSVFQSVMDRAGINLASKENYGDEVLQWGRSLLMALGDKPGGADPIIPIGSEGTTSIYPVRFGLDGVHGVSPEGNKLIDVFPPRMQDPGAVKLGELEMVAAVAVEATKSAGALRNIKIA